MRSGRSQKTEVDLARARQQDTRIPMETLRKEKTKRKTGETLERRTRRLLERKHLAEDNEK